MPMKRILVGVDGSKHSKRACQYAVDLAKAFGSTIILATSFRGQTIISDDPERQYEVKGVKHRAQNRLAWYKELVDQEKIKREVMILDGPAAQALSDAAKRSHADIVIIGSRGRTNLVGLMFGSTAHTLMHIAHCPVIAIRLQHKLLSEN